MLTLISCASVQESTVKSKIPEPAIASQAGIDHEILYINNVNGRVLKSFYKAFGEKPDARWYRTDEGYTVTFRESSISTNVYLKPGGTIEYIVKYYGEDQLPKSVRHTVRSNFYDYTITHVSEVTRDGEVCYFVKVADKISIKTVRVINGEWLVVEEVVKQVD
jgi:hypothetical protein